MAKENVGKCPKCGADVYIGYSYYCSAYQQGCNFNLKKEHNYFGQSLSIGKEYAQKLINGESVNFKIKNKEGKPYNAAFELNIQEKEVSLKKIPNKKTVFNSSQKYYVQKKYAIDLNNINADIHIGKGTKRFILEKLKNIEIHSFKASSPYVNIESIIKNLELHSNVEKIFVISSDEVSGEDSKIRKKRNRDFLEGITYYSKITYGNGHEKREQHFEDNLMIYPFKYKTNPEDENENSPNYFNLHSKFYLINNQYAFIGSANLTEKGLSSNFETLFFIDKNKSENNRKLIEELIEFFEKISKEKNIEKESEIFKLLEDDIKESLETPDSSINSHNSNDNSQINNKPKFEDFLINKIKSFFKL